MLKLSLLGPFIATLENQLIDNFKTQKVQALLIILAMEPERPHRRESLMSFLWPDMPLDSAQVNLRQTIYRLRQSIPEVSAKEGDTKVPLLVSDRHFLFLNPEAAIQVDVHQFQAALESKPEEAASIYKGPFLIDFYLVDSNPFEEWAQQIRRNLQRRALNILESLTDDHLLRGDYIQAQTYAWQQLEVDSLQENAYRQLMVALVNDGQRSAAISQFKLCKQRLKKDLGTNPSPETVALYEQIQTETNEDLRISKPNIKTSRTNDMPVFLLTDIEGSTRLWDQHHQAMLPALFKHNQILEENINRYGGRILELRGDGVKAVFEGGDPLTCLIAIQQDLGQADWGEIGNLRIRAGLHGVPTVRKGYDYFKEDDQYYGPVLNHTARVMDAGWGGQILVSERVHNTLSLPKGATWQDFGQHQLKSLDEPVHIYGLVHPDMPITSFPDLRTLSETTPKPKATTPVFYHNLPPQPTPFIGRNSEIQDLISLLKRPSGSLITIVGPGGMGKTRLALAVSEKLVQEQNTNPDDCPFQDGICFVQLAPLDHPDQIIPTIAKVLKIPSESSQSSEALERGGQTAASQEENLVGYLGSKKLLVVLDNFEHILEGAGTISGILQGSPTIKLLVTSRERLQLRGEQIYPIQGLDFPDIGTTKDPCDFTAIELFDQSARMVQPDFELLPEDMAPLTRICELVDGMPLGLELAASWVNILSLDDIAAEIQSSLDFLGTDIRNIPDRHRSIRAVFDSSWSRLTKTEKQIYPRLSIFRGEFSRKAAGEVALASLHSLAALTSKSLIHYDPETTCYHIHELLRQYATEHLAANTQDHDETRSRHSSYYSSRMQQHLGTMMEGDMHSAVRQIEASYSNIQSALDWAIRNENISDIDQVLTCICLYHHWFWQAEKGLGFCNIVLDLVSRLKIRVGENSDLTFSINRLYAKALAWKGFFYLQFDTDQSRKYLDQSFNALHELESKGIDTNLEKFWTNYFRASVDFQAGDLETARNKLLEGIQLGKTCNLPSMVLRNLSFLGDVSRATGAPREARRWYQKSLEEAKAQNNRWGEIDALNDLGWAARSMMAYDEAQQYYQSSYQLSEANNDQWEMVGILHSLGWLSLLLGKLDQATRQFSQAVEISEGLGMPQRALSAQIHIGIVSWLAGDFQNAGVEIQKAQDISADLSPLSRLFPAICLAEYFILVGRYPEAKNQIHFVQALTRGLYVDRFLQGRLNRVLGFQALVDKDYAGAVALFKESIEIFQIESDDEQVAWSQAGLARALMGQGQLKEAQNFLTEALWTSIEIKGFIPLVFTLPITLLVLVLDDPELAAIVYQQIHRSPFLANAKYFNDIVYKFLPETIRSSPTEKSDSNLNETLWNTAAGVLSKWIQIWMEPESERSNGLIKEKSESEHQGHASGSSM